MRLFPYHILPLLLCSVLSVAWGTPDCPHTSEEKPKEKDVPAYLDDHTLSGLLEDD